VTEPRSSRLAAADAHLLSSSRESLSYEGRDAVCAASGAAALSCVEGEVAGRDGRAGSLWRGVARSAWSSWMIAPRQPEARRPGPSGPALFPPTGGSCRSAARTSADIMLSCQRISSRRAAGRLGSARPTACAEYAAAPSACAPMCATADACPAALAAAAAAASATRAAPAGAKRRRISAATSSSPRAKARVRAIASRGRGSLECWTRTSRGRVPRSRQPIRRRLVVVAR
jgi:hypothetical protein